MYADGGDGCTEPGAFDDCEDINKAGVILATAGEYIYYDEEIDVALVCPYLFLNEMEGVSNKDIFNRFLTALILSLVVCLTNIGLALFGFLLFRTPGEF